MIVPVFFWSCCFLLVGVLLADLAYRRYASKKIQGIIENVPTFAAIPTPSIPDYEVLPIQTRDDLILEACIHHPIGPPRGIVVFCPELNGNHWTVLHYGRALIESGFIVLSFDFRNQGRSQHSRAYQPIHWVTSHASKKPEISGTWLDRDWKDSFFEQLAPKKAFHKTYYDRRSVKTRQSSALLKATNR